MVTLMDLVTEEDVFQWLVNSVKESPVANILICDSRNLLIDHSPFIPLSQISHF